MTPDEIAAVKAEHEPDDRHDADAWCMACADAVPWPCLPYLLAVEVERLADKVARVEALADEYDAGNWREWGVGVRIRARLANESKQVRAALADQPEQT